MASAPMFMFGLGNRSEENRFCLHGQMRLIGEESRSRSTLIDCYSERAGKKIFHLPLQDELRYNIHLR